jgi:hypothetical protein
MFVLLGDPLAKAAACPAVCRFSFGSAIHCRNDLPPRLVVFHGFRAFARGCESRPVHCLGAESHLTRPEGSLTRLTLSSGWRAANSKFEMARGSDGGLLNFQTGSLNPVIPKFPPRENARSAIAIVARGATGTKRKPASMPKPKAPQGGPHFRNYPEGGQLASIAKLTRLTHLGHRRPNLL